MPGHVKHLQHGALRRACGQRYCGLAAGGVGVYPNANVIMSSCIVQIGRVFDLFRQTIAALAASSRVTCCLCWALTPVAAPSVIIISSKTILFMLLVIRG